MTTCSVCASPYAAVSDDPSPAHPGCAPSDRNRFDAATRGVRVYVGRMAATTWSTCAGCEARIEVGATQVLATVDGRRCWTCESCAVRLNATRAAEPSPVPLAPVSPVTTVQAATEPTRVPQCATMSDRRAA